MKEEGVMGLHFLSPEEERAIKDSIPWESLDYKIRDLVRLVNTIDGVATVQSCAGHIHPIEEGFSVDCAHIALKATKDRTLQILFDILPSIRQLEAHIRYFSDGTFWISVDVDPASKYRLHELFKKLAGDG